MNKISSTSRKEKFKTFCELNPLPIYVQDWYLDLVCGSDNWDVCVVERGANIAAVLPYYLKKNRLFRWIAMPQLSKLHGPYLSPRYQQPDYHHSIVDELIEQLPEVNFYQQGLSYGFKNWLPYLWKGFSQVTLYSYIFRELDCDKILVNMDADCRRRIKKSEGKFQLRTDLDAQTFYALLGKTFGRQNLPAPFTESFFLNYHKELSQHVAGRILSIHNMEGEVQCAAFIVWDSSSVYYLLEASDPELQDRNAGIYMKWRTIKYTKEILNISRFDFEGSISKRIEKIYREFGAEAEPYFVIKKYYSKKFLFLKFIQNYKQYGKLVQW